MTLSKKLNQSAGDQNRAVGLTETLESCSLWSIPLMGLQKRACMPSVTDGGPIRKWRVIMHLRRIHHDVTGHLRGESKVPKSPKDHKNKETGQIGAVQLTLVRNGEPSIP